LIQKFKFTKNSKSCDCASMATGGNVTTEGDTDAGGGVGGGRGSG
jgi:hypothetical protein